VRLCATRPRGGGGGTAASVRVDLSRQRNSPRTPAEELASRTGEINPGAVASMAGSGDGEEGAGGGAGDGR
jgi:hypothetical protein